MSIGSFLVLLICVGCYFMNNIYQNKLSATLDGRIHPLNLYQIGWMTISCVLFIVMELFSDGLSFSGFTMVVGMAGGICQVMATLCLTMAMSYGTLSMTILIFSMYVIITPILSGIFLNEKVTFCQVIAIILIVIVLVLSNFDKSSVSKKNSIKWWIYSIASAAMAGLNGFFMRIHQHYMPQMEEREYSICGYVTGCVIAGILFFFYYRKETVTQKKAYSFRQKDFWIPVIVVGLAGSGINLCNLYNSSRLSSIIQYPVTQLLTMLLTIIYGVIALKNKVTRSLVVCMGLGMTAIVLMNF